MFVLDAEGTVYWSNVSSMPFERPALDGVLVGLQFAQQQDYRARGGLRRNAATTGMPG